MGADIVRVGEDERVTGLYIFKVHHFFNNYLSGLEVHDQKRSSPSSYSGTRHILFHSSTVPSVHHALSHLALTIFIVSESFFTMSSHTFSFMMSVLDMER